MVDINVCHCINEVGPQQAFIIGPPADKSIGLPIGLSQYEYVINMMKSFGTH